MVTESNIQNMPEQPGLREGGFTLIELMIVVTIVSILAVIAMPAYQDYVIRSKVTEGMTFVAEAKTSVSEKYSTFNVMATNNVEAGLPPADSYDTNEFVRRLEVNSVGGGVPRDGTIVVTFKIIGSTADNKQLWLVPSTATGPIIWTCRPGDPPNNLSTNHAPANCRG